MEKKIKILPPTMPNFIQLDMPVGKREDGIKGAWTISVEDLSEAEANEFADLMRSEFMKHWQTKATQKKHAALTNDVIRQAKLLPK